MSRRKIGAGIALALAAGSLSLNAFAANAETSTTISGITWPDADALVTVGSDTTYLAVAKVADAWNGGAKDTFNSGSSAANKIATYDPNLSSYDTVSSSGDCYLVRTVGTDSYYAKRGDTSGSGGGRKALRTNATSGNVLNLYKDNTCTPGAGNVNQWPKGSQVGLDTPSGGVVDFARASSYQNYSNADVQSGDSHLTFIPYAWDELVVGVSGHVQSYAPATLTLQNVKDIYTGVITNWKSLGGPDAAIHAYIPGLNSGTHDDFLGALGLPKGSSYQQPATVQNAEEHSPVPVQDDPAAIAPFSIGRAILAGGAVKAVLGTGSFAFPRVVFNVVRTDDKADTWVTDLFGPSGYFCSTAGQALVTQGGLYPLDAGAQGCGSQVDDTTSSAPTSFAHGTGPGDPASIANTGYVAPPTPEAPTPVVSLGGVASVKWGTNYTVSVSSTVAGTATLTVDGASVGSQAIATANGSTVFTISGTKLQPGKHTFTATVTAAGKAGAAAKVITITDKRPKAKKVTYKWPTFSAKKKGKVTVTIAVSKKKKSAAGTVQILDKGKVVGTAKIKKGKVTVTVAKLKKGKHKLTLKFLSTNLYAKSFSVTKTVTVKK